MSGRENIYLTGAMLKMTRREIDSKFKQIIEFSELGDFIDSPVGTYSSGMRVRLGFSIAASVEPEILLLDEVLAVGDKRFKVKCYKRIDELSRRCAIIIVSQSAEKIARIANSIMVLHQGQKAFESGDLSEGMDYYHTRFRADDAASVTGFGRAAVLSARFVGRDGRFSDNGSFKLRHLDDLELEAVLSIDPEIPRVTMDIIFFDSDFNSVGLSRSNLCGFEVLNTRNPLKIRVRFPEVQLVPRSYFVTVQLKDPDGTLLVRHNSIARFQVVGSFSSLAPFHLKSDWSYV
jgi:lipopolysaccharide transport system ATP-binding protein